MKKLLLFLSVFFLYQFSGAQTVTFSFPKTQNEYEVFFKTEENNNFVFFIKDEKRGKIEEVKISKNSTASNFVDLIVRATAIITDTFYLETTSENGYLKVPKGEIKNDYVSLINGLDSDTLITLIKPSLIYVKNNKSFTEFISEVKEDPVSLIEGSEKFNFIKSEEGYMFIKADSESFEITDEEAFLEKFIDVFKVELISLLLSEEDYEQYKKLELSERESTKLRAFFEKVLAESDYSFLDNVTLTDAASGINSHYQVEILNNHEQNYFILKFCDSNFTCQITQKLKYDVSETQFKEILKSYAASSFDGTAQIFNSLELTALYSKIRSYKEERIINDRTKPLFDSINGLIKEIENATINYSGAIISKKAVPVYNVNTEFCLRCIGTYFKNTEVTKYEGEFIIDHSTVRIFNNRVKDIVIVGHYKDERGAQPNQVSFNNRHSIPLRALNNSEQMISIASDNQDEAILSINFNDIFDYLPVNSTFNYSPRNKEYLIKPGDTIKVEERKLMDYFTAVIFSDFLGLNSEKSNAVLQAEARMKIPLYIANFGRFAGFHSINVDFNATLFNGFDDDSRFITPQPIEPGEEGQINLFIINYFDYVKYQNLNTGISLNAFNWELRSLSTELSLAFGARYFRSGLKQTFENEGLDEEITFQLNALTPEISTNFEIRPHLNFGADLNLALNWLHGRGSTGDVNILYNPENGNDDKKVFRVQLNLYSKVNPELSNSGIYGRLGGYYHSGSRDFYPQILVGYATNLSSFVNSFKGD